MNWIKDWLLLPITKRKLGILFILLGTLAILGSLAMDLVGGGQFSGIGPAQFKAMLASGVIILVGMTLLPLGDRPA